MSQWQGHLLSCYGQLKTASRAWQRHRKHQGLCLQHPWLAPEAISGFEPMHLLSPDEDDDRMTVIGGGCTLLSFCKYWLEFTFRFAGQHSDQSNHFQHFIFWRKSWNWNCGKRALSFEAEANLHLGKTLWLNIIQDINGWLTIFKTLWLDNVQNMLMNNTQNNLKHYDQTSERLELQQCTGWFF